MNKTTSFYSKARINTVVALGSTGLSILLSTAITPMIVLSLGLENWARYAFFLLYVAAFQFAEAALQAYVLQLNALANTKSTGYQWYRDRALRYGLLWTVVAIVAVLLVNYCWHVIDDFEMRHLLSLAAINVIPRAMCAVLKGSLLGQQSQKRYYAVTTAMNVARPLFLLTSLVALNGASVVLLALLYVLFSFMELLILCLLLGKLNAANAFMGQAKGEHRLLPSLMAANVASTVSTNLDKILAFGSLNLRVLGEYTFASQIAALLYLFVNSAVAAFSPKFRELHEHGNSEEIRRYLLLLSLTNNFLILTATAIFVINAEVLLSILSKQLDYSALVQTFAVLAGAVFVSSNLWFPGAISVSTGKANFSVLTNVCFIASYICCFFILRDQVSTEGAAFSVSMLAAALVTTVTGMAYFKRKVMDFDLSRYMLVAVLLPVFVVGATYWAPAFFISQEYGVGVPGIVFSAAWIAAVPVVGLGAKHLLAKRGIYAF